MIVFKVPSCFEILAFFPIMLSDSLSIFEIKQLFKITECSIEEFLILVPAPILVNGPKKVLVIWQSLRIDTPPNIQFSIMEASPIATLPVIC